MHCQCLAAVAQSRADNACVPRSASPAFSASPLASPSFANAVQLLSVFIKEFRAADTAWGVPVLATLARSVRLLAMRADAAQGLGDSARLYEAGQKLQPAFAAAGQGAKDAGKRAAMLPVANQSLKIFFRLDKLTNCKNLIKALEAPTAPPMGEYAIAERVTYRFYTGRLEVFNESYAKADGAGAAALGRSRLVANPCRQPT